MNDAGERIARIVMNDVKKLIIEELPGRTNDVLTEYIHEIVDDKVARHIDEKLTGIFEGISRKYCIPLDRLLREAPELDKTVLCKGTFKNGTRRCGFKAMGDGYCRFHTTQGMLIERRTLPQSVNLHTHGTERVFVRGCPGCEPSNQLIDMRAHVKNE